MTGILAPLLLYNINEEICIDSECQNFKYGKLYLILSAIQFICEYGDNHYEYLLFFRHRYSFELLSLLMLVIFNFKSFELEVIQIDLIACLAYRMCNCLIETIRINHLSIYVNKIIFYIFGKYYFHLCNDLMINQIVSI